MEGYLEELRSSSADTQFSGLIELSTYVLQAPPDQIISFGLENIISPVVNIFTSTGSDLLKEYSVLCILNIVTEMSDSAIPLILQKGLIESITQEIKNNKEKGITENAVNLFYEICKKNSQEIGNRVEFNLFLEILNRDLGRVEKRNASRIVKELAANSFKPEYYESLTKLSDLFIYDDSDVAENMSIAFSHILSNIGNKVIDGECFDSVITALNFSNNGPLVYNIITGFLNHMKKQSVSKNTYVLFSHPQYTINYIRLLESKDFYECNKQTPRNTLLFLSYLLPAPDYPEGYIITKHFTPPNAIVISRNIRDVIISYINKSKENFDVSISLITSCLTLRDFDLSNETMLKLASVSTNEENAVSLVVLANLLIKKEIILPGVLQNIKDFKTPYPDWFAAQVKKLTKNENIIEEKANGSYFTTLEEMLSFIANKGINTDTFLKKKYVNVFVKLSSKEKCNPGHFNFKCVTRIFEDILVQCFKYKELKDPIHCEYQDIPDIKFPVKFVYRGNTFNKKLNFISTFGDIEFIINSNQLNLTVDSVLRMVDSNPELHKILDPSNYHAYTRNQLCILCRAIGINGYKKFVFKYKENTFDFTDSVYTSLVRLLPTPEDIFRAEQIITVEDQPPSYTERPKTLLTTHKMLKIVPKLLKCYQNIIRIDPYFDLYSKKLEGLVQKTFNSFNLNIGCFSPGLELVNKAPYLFSDETKFLAFKMGSFDPFSSLNFANKVLANRDRKLQKGNEIFFCTIERSNLFADGLFILKNLAIGPTEIYIQFKGEIGYGRGPANEFYGIMAKEFARNKNKIFRSTTFETEFATAEGGLYPLANANKDLFYPMGILCAKTISNDLTIPFPLSNAFIKLVKGEPVTFEEADSALAKMFSNPEDLIGLDFAFPGIDDLDMGVSDEEITEENVHKFIKLVEEFTIGRNVLECANEFRRGFTKVIPSPCFNAIDANCFQQLISNSSADIKIDDFFDGGVNFEEGIADKIMMMINVIERFSFREKKLFIKFITGSECLPIGGLKALQPKLTIAIKNCEGQDPDKVLPSASTCTHYLKIPSYTNYRSMLNRIRLAITECEGYQFS